MATALAAAATEAEREREVEVASTATSPNLLQPLSKRIRGHQRYGPTPLSTERGTPNPTDHWSHRRTSSAVGCSPRPRKLHRQADLHVIVAIRLTGCQRQRRWRRAEASLEEREEEGRRAGRDGRRRWRLRWRGWRRGWRRRRRPAGAPGSRTWGGFGGGGEAGGSGG